MHSGGYAYHACRRDAESGGRSDGRRDATRMEYGDGDVRRRADTVHRQRPDRALRSDRAFVLGRYERGCYIRTRVLGF